MMNNNRRFGMKQMFETVGAKNRKMMVSYQTPVIIVDGENYFVTEERFSKTTTRHINHYLRVEQAIQIHKVPIQVVIQTLAFLLLAQAIMDIGLVRHLKMILFIMFSPAQSSHLQAKMH